MEFRFSPRYLIFIKMKTPQACKYSPHWNINIALLDLGFVEWEGISCQTVPEESLMSFSLFELSILEGNTGNAQGTVLGSSLRLGWAQREGLGLGIPWVGISLLGIPGGARGTEQWIYGFMANLGTGPDPHSPVPEGARTFPVGLAEAVTRGLDPEMDEERDLGMKILGISGKELGGSCSSLGDRQECSRGDGSMEWGQRDTGTGRSCSRSVLGSSFPPHAPIPSVCCK